MKCQQIIDKNRDDILEMMEEYDEDDFEEYQEKHDDAILLEFLKDYIFSTILSNLEYDGHFDLDRDEILEVLTS